jgi:hypothetical protein
MRYLTWKLAWPGDGRYGYGPEQVAAANGARLEASSWVDGQVETGTILGYLDGELDLSLLAEWDVTELDETEALTFAQTKQAEAFLGSEGRIAAPETPRRGRP